MSRRQLKHVAAGAAGTAVLNALLGTTRIEERNAESFEQFRRAGRGVVLALWHGNLLPPTYAHRGEGGVTLASRSRDGEYIASMLERWGYRVVRGSSSRGGDAALREMVRLARAGHAMALTVDGPRGPAGRLKHGVLRLAQLAGVPIVPVGSAASRAWRLGSWDRFMVPKPFSRLHIVYGEPVFVSGESDGVELAALAASVEAELMALTRQAEAALA
jgi:lysophospholipid acyltransferase (LPLAT)-like uncharacterized protein